MNTLTRTLLLGSFLVLTACAGIAPPPPHWSEQQARLEAFDQFTARGKIALRTPTQAESASLTWQQTGQNTQLHLQGPLGIAATTVESDGFHVEIRQGDDIQYWTTDKVPPGSEWDLPLQSMPYWLRGIPDPNTTSDALEFDPDTGRPARLSQQGWEVTYSGFGTFAELTLPTRMEVSRDDTWARIIVRRWEETATRD
ncbi:hypothetical protein A3709_11440 [Halioglobus sp. HI00S01]|uniref:lipoprotein insertase outer membrane protein LolB n=1 Tax=Halioglobus sp. HI00S01 TaxID=1822214 RepID=UPI0007C2EB93|nr:lipoprotein insertase outer membrane protein LolB [Halioglobus sp. HI00S01]KZX50358.1 hypothetical protein A3709_11440 [Halioglobus sp. HI00S01]